LKLKSVRWCLLFKHRLGECGGGVAESFGHDFDGYCFFQTGAEHCSNRVECLAVDSGVLYPAWLSASSREPVASGNGGGFDPVDCGEHVARHLRPGGSLFGGLPAGEGVDGGGSEVDAAAAVGGFAA